MNFWRPHGDRPFRTLQRGEPFFFKLRGGSQRGIVGFGLFERFEGLPAWQAWNYFGEMNGAADFDSMIDRIARLRGEDNRLVRAGDFQIGCIMLSAPVFFPPEDWVLPPIDWARTGIQQGKSYALDSGEGRRIFAECIERAQRAPFWNVEQDAELVAEPRERFGAPILVRPRLGQGLFSMAVRQAYGRACAVTNEHSEPVLEAAHILPYSQGGEHRVDNGLLLRRDLHCLFDLGYVTVTPDYVFRVGDRLREEFSNGRSYYSLNGSSIGLPAQEVLHPKKEFLEWHGLERFKG